MKKKIIFKANAVKELKGIHTNTICKDFERSLDYLGFSRFICNTVLGFVFMVLEHGMLFVCFLSAGISQFLVGFKCVYIMFQYYS